MPHLLLPNPAAIRQALPVIEHLRQSSPPDPTTAVDHFLSRTATWNNTPAAIILRHGETPYAAALFSMERRFGLPTGMVRGGSNTGDGLLIAPDHREHAMVAAIAELLAIPWVHTVLASLRTGTPAPPRPTLPNLHCQWSERPVATDLSLEGGFEAVLSRLGPRTRRNFRYYRRRAHSDLALAFHPTLTPAQSLEAVYQLHPVATHPAPRSRTLRREAAIRATPGWFAMGLQNPGGRWVSYLTGWRDAATTYVEWQLNDGQEPTASLSTVMRAELIDHECARHATTLAFVGGTTPALERACTPGRCLDLLVVRNGLRGRLGTALMATLSPRGQVTTMLQPPPAPP